MFVEDGNSELFQECFLLLISPPISWVLRMTRWLQAECTTCVNLRFLSFYLGLAEEDVYCFLIIIQMLLNLCFVKHDLALILTWLITWINAWVLGHHTAGEVLHLFFLLVLEELSLLLSLRMEDVPQTPLQLLFIDLPLAFLLLLLFCELKVGIYAWLNTDIIKLSFL